MNEFAATSRFPDEPAAVDRIRESSPRASELLADPQIAALCTYVSRASPALSRTLVTDPRAIEVFVDLDVREPVPADDSELQTWSHRETLRIAARDLSGLDELANTGALLADLASDVLNVAVRTTRTQDDIAIVGMGKLGGRELNYASDIDILFVGRATERSARAVLDVARRCFKVDAALRPEGQAGSLVRSIDSFENYWANWASPWEFQALLKARGICGNPNLIADWEHAAEKALWTRPFDVDDLNAIRNMKARSEELIARKGLSTREVKRGQGGIRDVEFAVQLLQLVHGSKDRSIRSRNTLRALEQLSAGGYVSADDVISLSESYVLLRNVEHRLQLVELQQTHIVPVDRNAREQLATTLHRSLDDFDQTMRHCRATVRHAFERLYFRPLLEEFAGHTILDESTIDARVSALGFSDASNTRIAVRELTDGLGRSSTLMRQMMPLVLDWLSSSPNPDQGLIGLRRLLNGPRTPAHLVAAFRDSPEVARRVCVLLGTSSIFERALSRHPELLESLDDRKRITDYEMNERMARTMQFRQDAVERRTTIARFDDAERSRISMFDVLGITDDNTSCIARSSLADTVFRQVTTDVAGEFPLAVIGLGRYGGEELGPGSDLDVMVVHNGNQQEAETLAQRLLHTMGNPSPAFRLYDVDYSLRPEGKQGPLARSVESCEQYYTEWASPWERQALLRARFVCGNADVARHVLGIIEQFVWSTTLGDDAIRNIRHLKARMETERVPRNEDARFHLKLGNGTTSDVEWTIQLLQLRSDVRSNNTMSALRQLVDAKLMSKSDADDLETSWRFCTRVRNRLSVLEGRPINALPTDAKRLSVLARSLATTPVELRETYLRCTRRARRVTERLFYGNEPK